MSKLKMFPNEMGNVFIRPMMIRKDNDLILPESKSRHECRVGLVVSEGKYEGELVLFHFAFVKRYRFESEDLFVVKLSDILSIVKLKEGLVAQDVFEFNERLKCYQSENNACGMPEVEDYT